MADEKPWFKRGRAGVGYRPQTWQGWTSLTIFVVILGGSVEAAQALLGEDSRGQSVALIMAAVEIIAFMKFIRGRTEPPQSAPMRKSE